MDFLPRDPPLIYAYGFAFYKKRSLSAFFANSQVIFVKKPTGLDSGSVLAVWGNTPLSKEIYSQCTVVRIEDGFLRSVGLGADLIAPISWAADWSGAYFDSSRPSDLEELLSKTQFDDALCDRAAHFRRQIISSGLTKYNVGDNFGSRPKTEKRVLLVVGQVETDSSIKYGSPVIKSNLALLRLVREAHPDAYVIYKPHPDVVARLRLQGDGEGDARLFCDELIENENLAHLLSAVDELHTMTSLAGFEALIRGLPVHCYGQPFYAGWGLTIDHHPLARRTRRLALDELVAGALLLYPRYMSLKTREIITPESAIDELIERCTQTGRQLSLWHRFLRVFLKKIARRQDRFRKNDHHN
jgi:capsular polysaccharide export protein